MEPTLEVGDVLLVEKITPRFIRHYQPGDVVLFAPPPRLRDLVDAAASTAATGPGVVSSSSSSLSSRDLFVKRVAASQTGDVVAVDRNGRVRINNDKSAAARDQCDAEPLGLIRPYIARARQQQQQLQQQPFPVGNNRNDDDDAFVSVLPPGTLAVLGDCSAVSIDSRIWGPLPIENVVGRPVVRLFPWSKFGPIPPLVPTVTDWNEKGAAE